MDMDEGAAIAGLVLEASLGPHIALVTLNRPQKRNAINGEVAAAIEAIVRRTEADPQVRAVILQSSDSRVFCAGADLSEVGGKGASRMMTADGGFAGFTDAVRLKPWIAAVEGMAVAGGCEICLACDMIVASEAARFGLPEVKRSLIAGAGGLNRLSRILPRNLALEMIATGDPIDAQRAFAYGMVNRLTAPGGALAAAQVLAEAIAANAPVAVQQALAVARVAWRLADAEAGVLVAKAMATVRLSEDYAEGPRAFLEKRPARWTGR